MIRWIVRYFLFGLLTRFVGRLAILVALAAPAGWHYIQAKYEALAQSAEKSVSQQK